MTHTIRRGKLLSKGDYLFHTAWRILYLPNKIQVYIKGADEIMLGKRNGLQIFKYELSESLLLIKLSVCLKIFQKLTNTLYD